MKGQPRQRYFGVMDVATEAPLAGVALVAVLVLAAVRVWLYIDLRLWV